MLNTLILRSVKRLVGFFSCHKNGAVHQKADLTTGSRNFTGIAKTIFCHAVCAGAVKHNISKNHVSLNGSKNLKSRRARC